MKYLLITLSVIAFTFLNAYAQKPVYIRAFPMQRLGNDSIVMYFDAGYFLIEDSCAAIIRRGHYNSATWKFTGPFEDRSSRNPRQIIAKGVYDKYGLKEGDFVAWYLNGKLHARGSFKNNRYSGIWDFYYPSGKPQLSFEATDTTIIILNAWDEYGTRTVQNSNGTYEFLTSSIVWRGKIINGKPHGKWSAGLPYFREPGVLATEVFVDGIFQQGSNGIDTYKDSSHINFLDAVSLPFTNAEKFISAKNTCNGRYSKILIVAYPPKGSQQLISELRSRLLPVLTTMDTSAFSQWVNLPMKILEDGKIIPDSVTGGDIKMVAALQAVLYDLPAVIPTTFDGKSIQQGLMIGITYSNNEYNIAYGFSQTKTDDKTKQVR